MRKLYLIVATLAGVLLGGEAALAQGHVARVVSACGSPGQTLNVGTNWFVSIDGTGELCVNATVTATASITGFTPAAAYASLSVSNASTRVSLPAGAVVVVYNTGSTAAYVTLGNSSVVATTGGDAIQPGSWMSFTPGASTYLAAITASSTTSLNISGGTGLPSGAGGGSSGGGSSSITTWAGGTLGAMANYGTSPGTVLVPGMNAFVTNAPSITNITGTITLPTGAATAALQTTGNTALTTINTTLGSPMQNSGGSVTANLGTLNGAATAALQTTINTTLGSPFQAGGSIGNTGFNALQGGNPLSTANPLVTRVVDASSNAVGVTGGAMNVYCPSCVAGGLSTADESNMSFGSSTFAPGGGFYQTTPTSNALTNGQVGIWQLTANRAGFVNLRNAAGTEVGTSSTPLQVTGANGTFPATQPTAANLNATVVGTGTFAVQLTGATNNINNISGTVSLPTGAATAALQTTGNTSLASIDTKTPALGQGLMSASVPVTIASNQTAVPASESGTWTVQPGNTANTTAWLVTGTGGTFPATQSGTWNITNISGTVSLPTGASTAALQTTGNTSLSSIDTKFPAQGQAAMAASVPVVIANNQSAVPASESGTWTVQPGNTANTTAWLVTGTGGTFPATQSGTWNVNNISGTISLPTGAATSALQTTGNGYLSTISTNSATQATAALQTTGNTSLATIATNSGTQATAGNQTTGNGYLSTLAGSAATGQNVAAPGNELIMGGQFNTSPTTITSGNVSPLQLDNAGNLKVNVTVGGGTGGTSSTFGSAFPGTGTAFGINDGTNMRGWTAIHVGSNYFGGVDLSSEAGTAITNVPTAVGTAGTGNTPTFNNYIVGCVATVCPSLGAATSANSSPVVIASDQAQVSIKGVSGAFASGAFASGAMASGSIASGAAVSGAFVAGAIADLAHGQGTMAASVPVAIASNQSAIPASQSGTWTVTGAGGTFPVTGASGAFVTGAIADLAIAQGATTSGKVGNMPLGAVTTSAPTYTNAQLDPLSLTTAGALRVDGSGVTQPVSGTVTATQATGSNLHVVCDSGCSSSTAPADESAFSFGSTSQSPIGGVYQTTATSNALTNGQMGAWQFTANRAGFVNLRNASGAEIGVAAAPMQVSLANTAANATPVLVTGTGGIFPVSMASGAVVSGAYSAGAIADLAHGQATMANSVPVALASNQSSIPVTVASGGIASGALASGSIASGAAVSGAFADGSNVTLGAKADAKSTATDTTAVTIMQVLKEISAMAQAPAALPANQSTNVAQFGGTNISTGTGAGGTGIPRVTVSNDSTVGLVAGSAIVGKVGIDQTTAGTTNAVSLAQIGTGTVATSGTGVQKVGIVGNAGATVDKTAAGAASTNSVQIEGVASGTAVPISAASGSIASGAIASGALASGSVASGAFASGSISAGAIAAGASAGDPCTFGTKSNYALSTNATALTQIIAASGSTKVYICSIAVVAAGASAFNLNYGTGSNCGTGTAALVGSTTAANGMSFAANGGLTLGNGSGTVAVTPASQAVCTVQSNAVYESGVITYVQQ